MRHRYVPLLALALSLLSAPAAARTVTIRQTGAPPVTIRLPANWDAIEHPRRVILQHYDRELVVRQCPLLRSERDMTGRRAARRYRGAIPVPGGTCLRGTGELGARLEPVLGPRVPAPLSDATAEHLARVARERTLTAPRATGTAFAIAARTTIRVDASFEWSLPDRYVRVIQRDPESRADVIHDAQGDHLNWQDEECWGPVTPPREGSGLEPRLELAEWNAPPDTRTAWRVSYEPPHPQPDGTTLVRWSGFVADGEAVIGADGRLRRVRIEDHGVASGRTDWRTVEITFSGFPAAITLAQPQPEC